MVLIFFPTDLQNKQNHIVDLLYITSYLISCAAKKNTH